MSIVSLTNGATQSNISIEDVHHVAAQLNFNITNARDAEEYMLLLRSFEAVMHNIELSSDYIHPSLVPQAVVGSREYCKPEARDNPLNAWSYQCHLRAARPTSDQLQGRTIVIKDNVAVGGLPTTLGTHTEILCKDGVLPISPIDATVVSRLLAAGAIIKGTSTCENFCASPLSFTSATGPVHHPLLHGYTVGGSSSGSCALVAADALRKTGRTIQGDTVQLAIGGDQAGSVRNPSCYTGLYGMKPTFGLVPYTGAASMTPMIDHLGPIASNLEDIAVLLKVMAGYDGIDPRMTPESPLVTQVPDYAGELALYRAFLSDKESQPTPATMKVGLLTESLNVIGLATEVRDMVQQATRRYFEAVGAAVVDISVPMHSEAPLIWTASTRPSMSQWLCQGRPSGYLSYQPPHIQPQWPPNQTMYELLTASNPALVNIQLSGQWAQDCAAVAPALEAKAHRKVFALRAAYDEALAAVDVLVTPCAPTVAMPHPPLRDGEDGGGGDPTPILERLRPAIGLTSNTCPFNVTGHPAMSVPCGTLPASGSPEVQFPVGMQLVARRWDEITLLKAAALFEEGKKMLD